MKYFPRWLLSKSTSITSSGSCSGCNLRLASSRSRPSLSSLDMAVLSQNVHSEAVKYGTQLQCLVYMWTQIYKNTIVFPGHPVFLS